MASLQGSFLAISAICSSFSSSSSSSLTGVSFVRLLESDCRKSGDGRHRRRMSCRSMVRKTVQGGAAATYAKEMERLSAKESLLLALSRSPFLEGRWNFEWFGSGSPGLSAARIILERFPSTLATLSKMDLLLKDGYAKVTANLKLLNSIESKFVLSTKVSVEGPLRMKEEYLEVILESPTVIEETIPEQLKDAYGQAVTTIQQLLGPIKDAVASGLRVPLEKTVDYLEIFLEVTIWHEIQRRAAEAEK